ncbi:unknown similar to AMEV203 [Mythimna separata entomopoxvirus 'L']|uniref:Uncharacterized protein n=1 Tax=Mythimna separata entomopoxvirus 'L' TaxID=1293572 RepID=A0A916P7M3_9POXV|nr:unknown similar to AMEV203 [Mythimna separata entomopoxvirus 'L']CCU56426.1 unknown similar to AMEV203 [Mythimna separata entomopoxvirus 'L']
MAHYKFDLKNDNSVILSDNDVCDDCVKNFTDIVMEKESLKSINDNIINKYQKFIETHTLNKNLIIDIEVKNKLFNS